MRLFVFFSAFLCLFGECFGANLLFLTLLGAPSHHIWNEALVGGLLKKGHNITLLGHDKPKIKSSNYTVLRIEDTSTDEPIDLKSVTQQSALQHLMMEWYYQLYLCELDLKSEVVKELLAYPKNFDLIIFDLGAGQCLYPLVDFFSNARLVGVSPFAIPPSIAEMMGHEVPSYVPIYSSQYTKDISLWERANNFFLQKFELALKYYTSTIMHKKSQEVFGKGIRDFYEVENDVVLLLTNNDPILDYPQPLPPHIIPVGGLHITESNQMNRELKSILDNVKNGAIYFSLGSFVKSSVMSQEVKMMFVKVFAGLKQTVLWKYDSDDLEVPENVIISKWFPQNDILAHKNLVLFISHCGGLSTQEATYFGVPVVGIPIFIDQLNNAVKIASKGGGLVLKYHELTYEKINGAITEVVGNKKYQKEMKRRSTLLRDQPIHPLDKAVFWIEYLLRNKEIYKGDLNPSDRFMRWYQKYTLHLFLILTCMLFFTFYGTKCIYSKCKTPKEKKKIKSN